mmetsp:Transcript_6295/g.7199  ORF Transcript_6295/g.7199 Transcript_6295/m.7199 type:complete len:112 (-) Transcript_6295:1222-1557(-)
MVMHAEGLFDAMSSEAGQTVWELTWDALNSHAPSSASLLQKDLNQFKIMLEDGNIGGSNTGSDIKVTDFDTMKQSVEVDMNGDRSLSHDESERREKPTSEPNSNGGGLMVV